ncbi:MAG: helix-turn-helix domain-containing protein [Roseibium sp.]
MDRTTKFCVLYPDLGRLDPVFVLSQAVSSAYEASMLVLPLPLVVALVLGFLFLQSRVSEKKPILFSALLAICALQNLVVALGQYYGMAGATQLQPITATIVPPIAWLAFVSASLRPVSFKRDIIHGLAPAFTLFCTMFAPNTLDFVIVLIFTGYGSAILFMLHRHRNALPLARLESGAIPQRIWTTIAIALLFSALGDIAIAFALQSGSPAFAAKVLTAGSTAALLAIGFLSLSPNVAPSDHQEEALEHAQSAVLQPPTEEDVALVERLEVLLNDTQFFLDPGLTLSRLALRLRVPAKQLSAAINRHSGENMSRYINRHRIEHACSLLRSGSNATEAMLSSGFNTKSNFNREFLRVTGKSPSSWVANSDS